MSETGNPRPPLSSFDLERQAAIDRNLAIQACIRAAAKWLRISFLRGARFARRVAAERRRRNAIRQLQRLDDRTLRDMGVHRSEIEFVVRNGLPARATRHRRQDRWTSAPVRARAA
jgi:uncharacterized protein YjiS (DUF1127 family)